MGNKVSNILGRGIVNDTRKIILLVLLKYAFFTCCLTSSEPSKAKTKASTSFFCSKHDETASSVLLRKIKLINFLLSSFSLFVKILKFPSGTKTSSFWLFLHYPNVQRNHLPISSPFSFWFLEKLLLFIIICIFEQRLFTCFR